MEMELRIGEPYWSVEEPKGIDKESKGEQNKGQGVEQTRNRTELKQKWC